MDGTIRARVAGHRATRLLRDVLAVAALATLGWFLMVLLHTGSAAADSGPEEPDSQHPGLLGGLLGGLIGTVENLTDGVLDQATNLVDPVVDVLPDRAVPGIPAPQDPPAAAPVKAAPAPQAGSSGRPVVAERPATEHRRPAVIAAAASATVPTGTVIPPSPRVDNADPPGDQWPGVIPAGPSAPVAPAGGVTCGPDHAGGFVVLSGPDRPEPPAGSAPIGHGGNTTGRHTASPAPTPD